MRPHVNSFALTILLILGLLPRIATAAPPEAVALALREARIPNESVALWVGPASAGDALFQHNADKAVNPASVMKLLTTFMALDELGPAFTWKTPVWLAGDLKEGVLHGDLVVRGSGDPWLTWDRLSGWLREWRARGLRDIQGDIVVDRGLFASDLSNNSFDDSPQRAYNAMPDAFLVNFNALSLRLAPQQASRLVDVATLIPATPLRIVNRLRVKDTPCNDWRSGIKADFIPEGSGYALQLEGVLPQGCGERLLHLSVPDGLWWSGAVLRALWLEQGGRWHGEIKAGTAPADLPPFSTWESPPLAEILRNMDKYSNNVMARQVFLTLGLTPESQTTSPEAAIARTQAWMLRQGLDPSLWTLENGSGLSRIERTTAGQLGSLLRAAWRSPRMAEFISAQPILGMDGTMKSRLPGSDLVGKAFVKTGSLDGVRAAAGYMLTESGHWIAFAFVINHPNAANGEAALEALLSALYWHSPQLR